VRAIAVELAAAPVAAEHPGNGGGAEAALPEQAERVSFRKGDLAIQHR
jgi:hypothetical protein